MGDLALGSTPDRDLAALALDVMGWSPERALALDADPAAALARLDAMLVPAKDAEPKGLVEGRRGPKTGKLIDALALIGAKISPTMSPEQSKAWMAALTTALSDLPFAFSVRGAQEAIHTPMQFLNEVEGAVRERASHAKIKHEIAVNRLKAFQRRLANANRPALPAPEPKEYTQAEIDRLTPELRRLGLKVGAITQEQFDAAERTNDAE
jgi:hypothetical protein